VTIREHFQRLIKRVTYIVTAGALLVFILIEFRYPNLTNPRRLAIAFFSGLPLALLLWVFFRWRCKCPRCRADYGKMRRQQLGRFSQDRRMYWELWDACQNCGVRFAEPFSTSADGRSI